MAVLDKILLLKFIKFGVVGCSGMIVDFGVTYLLKEKAKLNKFLSNSAGFVLAATNNYIWNRLWTFHSKNEDIPVEYLSFFIISLIGLGINNLTIYLLADRLKWNFYFSKLCATAVVMVWNFTMNMLVTFR